MLVCGAVFGNRKATVRRTDACDHKNTDDWYDIGDQPWQSTVYTWRRSGCTLDKTVAGHGLVPSALQSSSVFQQRLTELMLSPVFVCLSGE